jgi:hypothetical protein
MTQEEANKLASQYVQSRPNVKLSGSTYTKNKEIIKKLLDAGYKLGNDPKTPEINIAVKI